MKYHVDFTEHAWKQLSKFDVYVQKMILLWLNKNINNCDDPRILGKPLSGNRSGQWRYRVGDYRIIVEIQDNKLIVLVVATGHRKNVYEKNR